MPIYLIQGFFFQHQEWLGLIMDSGEGAIAVINGGLCRFMYAGVIHSKHDNHANGLIGEMNDVCGESVLSSVDISPKTVKFIKKYNHRVDLIEYEFHRAGDIWVGKYSGPAVGEGGAKCVITEVGKDLFRPPEQIH